jgi:acetylornithine deacetylase
VPPFWKYERKDKNIKGRGSVDAKGSVATQIIAANGLLSTKEIHPDDVSFLYVVGEETGGDGMRAANYLKLKPKTIIFGEPTEGKLASGHKGMLSFKLIAKGKAAHSGYPWLGLSANEVLVTALAALMELGQSLPEDDKFGLTTINLGKIQGGVAHNVVAESAEALIAVRIAQGTPAAMKNATINAIDIAVAKFLKDSQVPRDIIDIEFSGEGYSPIDIDADVPGFESIIVNYGTDIPNLKQTVDGQKRYLYGPGTILVAHSDHEALSEKQLINAVGGYVKLILHALGKKDILDEILYRERRHKESL